jgi:hypothetical protein
MTKKAAEEVLEGKTFEIAIRNFNANAKNVIIGKILLFHYFTQGILKGEVSLYD